MREPKSVPIVTRLAVKKLKKSLDVIYLLLVMFSATQSI